MPAWGDGLGRGRSRRLGAGDLIRRTLHCHHHCHRLVAAHRPVAQIEDALHSTRLSHTPRRHTIHTARTPILTPNDTHTYYDPHTPTHTPQVSLRGHQTAKQCWTSTRSALRTFTWGLRPAYLPNGAGTPTGRGHGFIIPQVSLRGHQTAKHCWTSTRSALRPFTCGLHPAYLPNGAGTPTGSNIA